MNPLQTHFQGLDSTDPITFDTSYDALLFSDAPDANTFLIEKCHEVKNNPFKHRILLQLLSARGSQVNKLHWYSRYQGSITLDSTKTLMVDALSDVEPKVRREAVMSLGDLCENGLSQEEMKSITNQYPTVVIPLRYQSFVESVIENLQMLVDTDTDVDVQLIAKSTLKQVQRDYKKMLQSPWFIPNVG